MLFSHSSNLGVGIIIGNPTGFNGKYLLAQHSAIAVNAGWSLFDNFGIHITGDYQYLFPGAIKNDEGIPRKELVPYLGIGGRLRLRSEEDDDDTEIKFDIDKKEKLNIIFG